MELAIAYHNKACDALYTPACNELIRIYHNYYKNYDMAFLLAQQSCDANDADGCFRLGYYYYWVKNDHKKSSEAYAKACKNGITEACKRSGLQ